MIKVMTLNLNGYGTSQGPWPVRVGLLREVIEDACPDVIALQAVRSDPTQFQGLNQAEQLADMFNPFQHQYFQPGMVFGDGSAEGSAIISRLRMVERDYKALSRFPKSEDNLQRIFMHAQLRLATGWLHLFNGFFSWVENQATLNIQEALQDMEGITGPALLVGDFNTPPESAALQPLRDHGWTDLWAKFYPERDGFTFFEAGSLVKRIDYAWANPELLPSVTGIKLVAGEVEGIAARPSDHAGLLVSLDLQGPGSGLCE